MQLLPVKKLNPNYWYCKGAVKSEVIEVTGSQVSKNANTAIELYKTVTFLYNTVE